MSKQDFYEIRNKCLKERTKFEDPSFLTDNNLLPELKIKRIDPDKDLRSEVKWLRPHEICSNPRFFVNDFSRLDVKQGEIGDCWFLSAVTILTLNPVLFKKVVCESNSFDNDYAGIFQFNFWDRGKWETVVIDDRLPTYNNQLIYAMSTDKNEFWIALLEKAYAKFKGHYKTLVELGTVCEAFEDLSGGITEKYCVKSHDDCIRPQHINFDELEKSFSIGNFMSCLMSCQKGANLKTDEKLVRKHAFSITNVKKIYNDVSEKKEEIKLIRLRNPWGNDFEWNGIYCDACPKWNEIPNEIKKLLAFKPGDDGEFWMTYKDFQERFDLVETCSLCPKNLLQLPRMNWNLKTVDFRCANHCENLELFKVPGHILTFKQKCILVASIAHTNVRQLMMNRPMKACVMPIEVSLKRIVEDTKSCCLERDANRVSSEAEIKIIGNNGRYLPRCTCRCNNIPEGKYLIDLNAFGHEEADYYVQIYCGMEYCQKIKKLQIFIKFFEKLCMRRSVKF